MLLTNPTLKSETFSNKGHGNAHGSSIDLGKIHSGRVAVDPDLKYCLFVSKTVNPKSPLFIAVHGIRRGMDSQARQFAPFVDSVGGVLVAPLFHKQRFPDYQRLGRIGRGDRADMALRRIIADVSQNLGRQFPQLVMFGYSGGGQFVHRYAMANPRQVRRIAIAAPGWFTFPDMAHPFPRGTRPTSSLPDVMFDPARFLEIPTLVMVGENDIHRDASLNKGRKIRIQQGVNRLDRGQRWIGAMSAAGSRFKKTTPFIFKSLPGCGHSFVECMQTGKMGRMVVDFLFNELYKNPPAEIVNKATNTEAKTPYQS